MEGSTPLDKLTGDDPAAPPVTVPPVTPTPPAAPPPVPPPLDPPPEGETVGDTPLHEHPRFKEVTGQNREMRERLAQLEQAEADRQRAALSEQDRLKADKEAADKRAEAAETRARNLERGGWLRAAAAAAGFADPEDAVALVALADDADQLAAQEAVAKLATDKPHLVRKDAPPPPKPAPIGNPLQPTGGTVPDPQDPAEQKRGLGADLLGMLTGQRPPK